MALASLLAQASQAVSLEVHPTPGLPTLPERFVAHVGVRWGVRSGTHWIGRTNNVYQDPPVGVSIKSPAVIRGVH